MKTKIAIIGGGASGLAAVCALGENAEVTLYEHTDRVGKKILQTGAGRCNVMNASMAPERFICDDMNAAKKILCGSGDRIKDFFEKLGLVLHEEDEGRIYPLTNQAASVLDVLRFNAVESGVEIIVGAQIKGIVKKGKEYAVRDEVNGTRLYDKIILACGGKLLLKQARTGPAFCLPLL